MINFKAILFAAFLLSTCNDVVNKTDFDDDNSDKTIDMIDTKIVLNTANNREVVLRYLEPDNCNACPLIVFSHGANSTYDRYDALLLPLTKAGFRIAVPNHTDSEDHPHREAFAPADWMPTRLEDYTTIAKHFKAETTFAAGHSFGALIAQVTGGAELSNGMDIEPAYRPKAVIAYSPPGPIPGFIGGAGWQKISVPSLVTTGTDDIVPNMVEQWELHLASFEAAPQGQSVALIYNNMDHYMNGAYGRETQAQSAERQHAMEHMIEATTFFLSSINNNQIISDKNWTFKSKNFVEARVN